MKRRPQNSQIIIKEPNPFFNIKNYFKIIVAGVIIFFIANAINEKSGNNYIKFNTSYEVYNKHFIDMEIQKVGVKKAVENFESYNKTMFLIDFVGSVSGEEVEKLKRDIDFILINSKQGDEVAIKLYSPGGSVTSYGLAASEIGRLKEANLKVTVLVDEVAASGGYMMAVVADKIIAAPFAYIGSIGVVAQLPIYEDFLKNVGVEYKVYTAGKSKRNVVSQIKPSPEDEEKLNLQLEKIHNQFKSHVKKYRTFVDVNKVGTGEVFSGEEALSLKLIDSISTSSNFLLDRHNKKTKIIYVFTEEKETKNVGFINSLSDQFINTVTDKLVNEVKSQFYNNYDNIRFE